MKPRITTITDGVATFGEAGAQLFATVARHAIAARGRFVVALTGGTTPAPIHRALAAPPFRDDVDWEKVVVLFGDERAVAPTEKQSNFHAANEDLLRHVPARVHRIEAERSDLAGVARDYGTLVRALSPIDLLFVGIGKDAHILSLFPGSPAIDETERLVVEEIDPPMDPRISRVTMTPVVVAEARTVALIATGDAKKEPLRRALHDSDDPKSTPVHLLRRATDLRLILDRAAFPSA